jgi:hypothetical protein
VSHRLPGDHSNVAEFGSRAVGSEPSSSEVELGELRPPKSEPRDHPQRLAPAIYAAYPCLPGWVVVTVASSSLYADAAGFGYEPKTSRPSWGGQFTWRARPSQYSWRNLNFWIFPVAVRGIAARNSTDVGAL